MNCEQVEELLSAYLDDMLAVDERLAITNHLPKCYTCSATLADYIRFDALLADLPRVSPDESLHQRIFSSPEYLELLQSLESGHPYVRGRYTSSSARRDTPGRPLLVALPGGRSTRPRVTSALASGAANRPTRPHPAQKRRAPRGLRILQIVTAAAILITLLTGALIARSIWLQGQDTAHTTPALTPPAGPASAGPLPAGMRFVFLRDGALWSAPDDGSAPASRLTPPTVSVAANWAVSPALAGRSAGNRLAYIDLQHAYVHTIRSDGQLDTLVQPPLLKPGTSPAEIWDTEMGTAILNGLAWSSDGVHLAFVADPHGTGLTSLYILSLDSGDVQQVSLPLRGSVSQPVWSPDGVRLAFVVTQNGKASILDYNIQNHGLLTIAGDTASAGSANAAVLTLNWSPDTNLPAITWSVGQSGHVHSIWFRRVGSAEMAQPALLATGDYTQALYSRSGHNGAGSWLLVTDGAGQAADLAYVDVAPGARPIALTQGRQVALAHWSPDGTKIDYLDALTANTGTLHILDTLTGRDTLISSGIAGEPAPAWSADSQQLAFSTGTQIAIVRGETSAQKTVLKLQGAAASLAWFAGATQRLLISLSDGQPGIYLVDTQRNSAQQVDQHPGLGPILWTEIP